MRFPLVVCVFVCFAVMTIPSFGQSPNGNINGLVADATNAAVADADIVAVNDVTGVQYTTKTNTEGMYVLPNLPPGPYRVQVSKIGFKTLIKPDITLNVQDALSINFTLLVGAFHEIVTVQGGAPLLNSESAAVSTVIDQNFVENLPLNGRSFNTLMQLTPGVVTAPATVASPGQFSIAGQRTDANNFTVDGISVNFGVASTVQSSQSGTGTAQAFSVLGGTSSLVSVDALEEFRIETSSFAPEFGQSPGGQVLLTTRSGTNAPHGGLYEYFRNDALDAEDWFADNTGAPKAPERHNDFGGSFGGPILKDRTFFFLSYEGARLRLPQTELEEVPSAYARSSASTAVAPFLNAYPEPANAAVVPGVYLSPFTGAFSNLATLDAGSVRLDHTVNQRFSIFARYNNAPSQTIDRVNSLSELETTEVNTQTATLGVNTLFNDSISNMFRGNYSSQTASSASTLDSFGGASPPQASVLLGGLPAQNNLAYFFPTGLAYYSRGPIAKNRSRQADFNDALSLAVGTHLLKFGGDHRAIYLNVTPPNYTAELLASSIQGFLASQSMLLVGLLDLPAAIVSRASSVYAQDTWKLNRRMTLTYGLRWEIDPAPSGRDRTHLAAWENVANPASLSLAPFGTPLWNTGYGNVAPRVGLAYGLSEKGDLVLRAGWGIYYDLGLGSSANTAAQYPNSNTSLNFGVPVPLGNIAPLLPGPPSSSPPYPSLLYAYSPNLTLPRSYQWNVALDKSFAGHQAVSASYVGQAGRSLLRQQNLYQPNSNFSGEFFLTQNGAKSNYDALQLQYRRPFSSHLQVLANYTWSHSLDNASDDVAIFLPNSVVNLSEAKDYASSNFDVRHSMSAALVYDVPATPSWRPLLLLTSHWSLSTVILARSGFPFNAALLFESADPGGYALTRPDQVPGQPLWIHQHGAPGGRMLNPSAFAIPMPIRQGTEGRNNIEGFGLTQADLSLLRKFPLTDRVSLQFRADAFNVLNHPNFTNPDGYIELGQFGLQSTQMANQGLGGLNPLFQSGGPRSLQLSLRLAF